METEIVSTTNKPWKVVLSCCGRDDGEELFETWEEADAFREGYTTRGPGVHPNGYSAPEHEVGHRRAGIVTAVPLNDEED